MYTETTRLALSEPGLVYCTICRDDEDRTIFHFFEGYLSQKAFDAHNEQAVVQEIFAKNLIKGVKARFAKPIPASEDAVNTDLT